MVLSGHKVTVCPGLPEKDLAYSCDPDIVINNACFPLKIASLWHKVHEQSNNRVPSLNLHCSFMEQ